MSKKIRMLVDDERLGFKKGEIYEVTPYWLYHDKLSVKNADFNVYRDCEGEEWEWYNIQN